MTSGSFAFGPDDFLHYRVHGSGSRHLLFLHGFAASLQSWDDLIPLFPDDEFTLHRLDLKGHGGSCKRARGDYSASHNARMVTAYVRSRTTGPVTIIAHSYGGVVALLAAMEQTQISGLILIGVPAFPQQMPRFMNILGKPLIGPLLMTALSARYIARRGLESAFHRRELITAGHIHRYTACYRDYPSARGLARTVRQMIPDDHARIIGRYRNLTLPVLLLWGEHDRIVPISQSEKLQAELPASRLVILPDCGHNPHEEQPVATYAVIRDFLADAEFPPGSASAPR